MEYTIQQVSKMTGIPSSTLRFYDKAGLLPFLSRGASGYRMFSDLDLGSIQIIQCLKKTGLSIDQIRLFTEWVREGDATLEKRRELFRQQKKEIENRINQMTQYLKKYQNKVKEFGPGFEKYFNLHYDEKSQAFILPEERCSVVERELDLAGYFCIVTSEKMSAKEAIELYKSRDVSEKLFRGDKSYLGNKSIRVYSEESARAKIFVEFVAMIVRCKMYIKLKEEMKKLDKKLNYMTVPAAIKELEKIEMVRQLDNIYRLDHAVTANQKVILKAFGLDANSIKYFASELSKELKKAE